MIVFRQREFSWINTPNDLGPDNAIVVPKLIIKSFEMAKLDNGDYLKHWICDRICGGSFRRCIEKRIPLQLPLVFATGEDFNELSHISPLSERTVKNNIRRFKNSEEFITYVKKDILSDRLKGIEKYPHIPLKKMIPDSTYTLIFRTISLALSGQINEYIYNDMWNNIHIIEGTDINYYTFHTIPPDQICKLFNSLLVQVLGYSNKGIDDLAKLDINWY